MSENLLRKKFNLLIIDNSEDIDLCKSYLESDPEYEYIFHEAVNGKDGLELCKMQHHDCIMLNISLPDMDGMQLLFHISQIRSHVPVVMLGDDSSIDIATETIKMGAIDYILKSRMTSAA